jgi:hypothetical protein
LATLFHRRIKKGKFALGDTTSRKVAQKKTAAKSGRGAWSPSV